MKLTRKQKVAQQEKSRDWLAGRRVDRDLGPIHEAIRHGELTLTSQSAHAEPETEPS